MIYTIFEGDEDIHERGLWFQSLASSAFNEMLQSRILDSDGPSGHSPMCSEDGGQNGL